jgi:hypothetical protein
MRNFGGASVSCDDRLGAVRKINSLLLLPLLLLGLLGNSACVTKTVASTGSQIAVTFVQLPPGSLQTSGQVQLTVTVANDPTNQGVLWNASCSSTNCGTFNPPQTLSGATTVYTAPSAVPTGGNVNLTAMAAANHSVSQTITIPIVSSVTIAFTQAPQNLQAGSSEPVVAQVTGDSSGKGVTWSVTCSGSSNCGSISPMQTLSGSAATFTAPSTVPAGGQMITIIAASTADPSQQITAVITVSPSAGIAISFAPGLTPPTSMQTSGAANIAATVTGDNTNAGVDWTATCTGNSGNCGTFSVTPAHTASASPITYTAPATVPAGGLAVTITAAATASQDKITVAATVTVSVPVVSISPISGAPSTLQVGKTANLSVTITNDSSTNGGATWSVTCGSAGNCGTFNPLKTTTSGSSATVYTAPPSVPTGTSVTITAMSNADNTKTSTAMIQITSAGTISIAFAAGEPKTSMFAGATQNITANVTNDTGNGGVNWTVTCTGNGANGCGMFLPTNTMSGAPTTYTAPTIVPTGGLTVTITATAADNSPGTFTSAAVMVTVPTTTVTLSSLPTTLQVGAMQSITATVTNDPGNGGVSWTVTCAPTGANCGSFNPMLTLTGVATTYSAPPTIPSGNSGNVVITATAADDASATATATVMITASESDGLLSGQYALSLAGNNSSGAFTVVGSIIADGHGNITSGEEDFNCTLFTCPIMVASLAGSTYTVGPDGRGTISLQTGVFQLGVGGVQTIAFAVVSPTRALVTEFDTSNASGSLDQQTTADFTAASISGGYAFLFTGADYNNGNSPTDFGGVFTAAGSGLTFTGTKDTNDNLEGTPTVTENAAFSGTFTAPDSTFGRGTFTGGDGSSYVYYVVNSEFLKFGETDLSFLGSGPAYAQGGSFASGTTYVFTIGGISATPTNFVMGGTISPGGASALTGAVDVNIAGNTLVSNAAYTGTFTAPSGGRGTLTLPAAITGGGSNPVAPGPSKFAMYLTANQGILLLDLDAGASGYTSTGISFAQSATTFNTNYAAVISEPANIDAFDVVGQIIATAATPAFSGTVGINNGGTTTPGVVVTGSYTLNGSGRDPGSLVLGSTTLNEVFYVADGNTVLCIETDASRQTSGLLQLQNPQLP